jgi:CheY-like chemotaxis protein
MQILLVEDDEVDVEHFLRNLQHHGFHQPVQVAQNGVEALAILREQAGPAKAPRPWLIITDIHMPRMNGLEFLRALRADASLAPFVAFVLTSSALEEDKRAAYAEKVAGYLLKSEVNKDFATLVGLLNAYDVLILLP